MKNFIKENGKTVISLFLNQFGAIVFALMLSLAIVHVENKAVITLCCILAIGFYLYLIHLLMWERGAKDRLRVDGRRLEPCQHKGFKIGLAAAAPTFLFLVLFCIFIGIFTLTKSDVLLNLAGSFRIIVMILEAMYLPILQMLVPGTDTAVEIILNVLLMLVFLAPAVFVTWLSYYLGYHGKLMPKAYKAPKRD